MVKRLRIKNFQSHVSTDIHFSPHVNVITGRNMTGKSSVLRALRLVFYNKPEGREFVQWGEKNAIIEVEYADHVLKRIKGSQNVYEVDGSAFTGFGRQIPEEVVNALGFASILVDRNIYELNYDHPHEAPFFVSETDAVKGKLFSRLGERVLSDLVLLDKSISSSNATLRKLVAEQQVVSTQIVATKESLVVFAPLPGIVTSFESCKESLVTATSLETELVGLRNIRERLQDLTKGETLATKLLDVDISPVTVALQKATSLQQYIRQLTQLDKLHGECAKATQHVSNTIQILQDLPIEQLTQAQHLQTQLVDLYNVQTPLREGVKAVAHFTELLSVDISPVTVALQDVTLLRQDIEQLRNVQTSLQVNTRNITVIQERQATIQAELEAALTKYKTLLTEAQKCPLCLRPIEAHDLDIILKELIEYDPRTVATKN